MSESKRINHNASDSMMLQCKAYYDITHLNWLRLKSKAEFFFKPENLEELVLFLQKKDPDIAINMIGAGSNVVLASSIQGIVIRLGKGFSYINDINEDQIEVGCGTLNYHLSQYGLMNMIKNFEFLSGIPGTVGGAVAMNAGAYLMETKDIIESVHALDFQGNKHEFSSQEIGFNYRSNSLPKDLIFYKAIIKRELVQDNQEIQDKINKIKETRARTQPINAQTAGSTFRNPEGYKAWELIDKIGGRELQVGGMKFSEKHCNFLINTGESSIDDLISLTQEIQARVYKQFQIELEFELKFIK